MTETFKCLVDFTTFRDHSLHACEQWAKENTIEREDDYASSG